MIISELASARIALESIKKSNLVAIDTETTGLNIRKDRIIGIGIHTEHRESFYFLDNKPLITVILNALKGKKLLAWNAYFDIQFIKNQYGADLWDDLHADVMCLKHTVDENPPFGLKDVAKAIYGHDATKEKEELKASIKKNGGTAKQYYKADTDVIARYCMQDCYLTFELFLHYSVRLKAEGLEDFFYKDEVMPLYKEVTAPMQARGVKVDVEKAMKLQIDITQDIYDLKNSILKDIRPHLTNFLTWYFKKKYPVSKTGAFAQAIIAISGAMVPRTPGGKFKTDRATLSNYSKHNEISTLLGPDPFSDETIMAAWEHMNEEDGGGHPFNLDSKHHLKKLFFDELNETPLTKTEKGNPQVNDDFISKMAEEYEWAAKLRDYNKLQKLHSSYIERIIDHQEDGIYYPSFNQHRTISGRYGSDIQQLPRHAEDGQFSPVVTKYRNAIRPLFISRNGHKFVDADYESLEPHIFAHVSNEQEIKDIFLKGHDFYSTIAIRAENIKNAVADKMADNYLGKINKAGRQRAKAYSLGIPYGMESYALAKSLDITQYAAEQIINGYLDGYPQLKSWMEHTKQEVFKTGRIRSEAGRVRRIGYAQDYVKKYGLAILDSLALYKEYSWNPALYDVMKKRRKTVKNALNNSYNFQIQSLAASIVNRATIALNRALRYNGINGLVICQIHDQIILEVEENSADKAKKLLQDVMENNYKISVPLKAPAAVGTNWGETH